jgi:hypothetical protein
MTTEELREREGRGPMWHGVRAPAVGADKHSIVIQVRIFIIKE